MTISIQAVYEVLIRVEAIFVSSALLATAQLSEGSKARLYPMTGKVPQWLPTIGRAVEARTIQLGEINHGDDLPKLKTSDGEKGKSRDWLPLLLREALSLSLSHS